MTSIPILEGCCCWHDGAVVHQQQVFWVHVVARVLHAQTVTQQPLSLSLSTTPSGIDCMLMVPAFYLATKDKTLGLPTNIATIPRHYEATKPAAIFFVQLSLAGIRNSSDNSFHMMHSGFLVSDSLQDVDAYAIAAEAFMNLSPWDYYNKDGSLIPSAATAEQLIHKALAINPRHPHALHLHIHLAEAGSPLAESGPVSESAHRAVESAHMLSDISPQTGHLVHMPSHIFLRVGLYKEAVTVNRAAYDFDLARGQQCITPYLPEHNVNMLVYAARYVMRSAAGGVLSAA